MMGRVYIFGVRYSEFRYYLCESLCEHADHVIALEPLKKCLLVCKRGYSEDKGNTGHQSTLFYVILLLSIWVGRSIY